MIHYKTSEEIKVMVEAGRILKEVRKELWPNIREGISTLEINDEAERLIIREGGEPSFTKVPGYSWTICAPINEQVVHTPPSKRKLKDGDILTVDVGVYLNGFHVDYSDTLTIGKTDNETKMFLDTGKKALEKAMAEVKPGNKLGKISLAIYNTVNSAGFYVLPTLTGHGVGRELHEDPFVPQYLDRRLDKTLTLKQGLTIAVEVIYAKGTDKISDEPNKEWSIISADRSLTACFEHSLVVTENGAIVLT